MKTKINISKELGASGIIAGVAILRRGLGGLSGGRGSLCLGDGGSGEGFPGRVLKGEKQSPKEEPAGVVWAGPQSPSAPTPGLSFLSGGTLAPTDSVLPPTPDRFCSPSAALNVLGPSSCSALCPFSVTVPKLLWWPPFPIYFFYSG